MGLDDEYIVDAQGVSQTLRCPICTDVYESPVFSSGWPCQHVFCRPCIDAALGRTSECPICRQSMTPGSLRPHPVVQSLLDEMHVRCRSGCGWTGRQDALSAHMVQCPVQELASLREKLAKTAAEHWERLASKNRVIEALQAQIAQVRGEAAQKDLRIAELQAELEDTAPVTRVWANARAGKAMAAPSGAGAAGSHQRAREAIQRTKEVVEEARCNRRAAEKRAREAPVPSPGEEPAPKQFWRGSNKVRSTKVIPKPVQRRAREAGAVRRKQPTFVIDDDSDN